MDEIALECKLARNYTMENVSSAVAYLLIKIVPSNSVDFGLLPMNVGMVIDVSASMRGKKIKCAIEAARLVVQSLRPDDRISVITFSDDARVVVPTTEVTDKYSILSAISKIRIRSGTRMYHGMEMGAREIHKAKTSRSINRMIILTDGQTEGEDQCQSISQREVDNKMVISTFGIGDKYNEELLREISDITLGGSYHLQNAFQIGDSFHKEVNNASAAVISNVGLSLNLPDSVELESLYRIYPDSVKLQPRIEADGRIISVDVGNLRKDESTCFGAQLNLPARPAGRVRVAQAYVTYSIPTMQVEDAVKKAEVVVQYSNDPNLCGIVDREVIAYFNQLNTQSLIEQAVRDTRAGNINAATQSLLQVQAITQMIGNVNLTREIEETIEELVVKGTISSGSIKTIRAESRQTVKIEDVELI